jgi:plasmid maintenance system antidote protein VapI
MEFNAGRAAKVAMAQRGKSRAWLAEQLNVSPQRASGILNNETASMATMVQMADLFGLSLSEYIALGEFEAVKE